MQHDSGYHLLFSHPELVEDLFKSFVTEPWVQQLDFTTLQRVNAKLHAEGLERRDGDLIYRVLYRDGSEVYLYLLLEFQSQPDPWMALRVLVYVGLLYQQLIRENRITHGKLPPVFPLVLYNGDPRWNAAQNFKDLIALPDTTPLWPYQPSILLSGGREPLSEWQAGIHRRPAVRSRELPLQGTAASGDRYADGPRQGAAPVVAPRAEHLDLPGHRTRQEHRSAADRSGKFCGGTNHVAYAS